MRFKFGRRGVQIRELQSEVAALRAQLDEPTDESWSRRRFFTKAGAIAAGGVAGAVLAASPAGADDPNDVLLGGANNGGTAGTSITSSNTNGTLVIGNTNTSAGARALEANASTTTVSTGIVATGGTGLKAVGFLDDGSGVFAQSAGNTTSTYAVRAEPAGTGNVGVAITNPGANTLGILADGTRAPIQLKPNGVAGAPSAGDHETGELVVDLNGELFLCLGSGTPGTWTKLNNQSGPGGGPQLVSPPQRVYDSRPGQPSLSSSPQGTLAFGASRTIDCAPSVPAGATAIVFNLTVANTAGSFGALAVYSASAPDPTSSNINWTSPGTVIANQVISACDVSQAVKVKCVASAGSSTHFILDVFAYYL